LQQLRKKRFYSVFIAINQMFTVFSYHQGMAAREDELRELNTRLQDLVERREMTVAQSCFIRAYVERERITGLRFPPNPVGGFLITGRTPDTTPDGRPAESRPVEIRSDAGSDPATFRSITDVSIGLPNGRFNVFRLEELTPAAEGQELRATFRSLYWENATWPGQDRFNPISATHASRVTDFGIPVRMGRGSPGGLTPEGAVEHTRINGCIGCSVASIGGPSDTIQVGGLDPASGLGLRRPSPS
jgi:hypothetical protein